MRFAMTILVVGGLFTGTALANAAGVSSNTPGHKMQIKGSVKGSPGASGYAPGQRMQDKGSVKGTTGASGYAPGRTTTGAGINSNVGVNAGGAKVQGGVNGSIR